MDRLTRNLCTEEMAQAISPVFEKFGITIPTSHRDGKSQLPYYCAWMLKSMDEEKSNTYGKDYDKDDHRYQKLKALFHDLESRVYEFLDDPDNKDILDMIHPEEVIYPCTSFHMCIDDILDRPANADMYIGITCGGKNIISVQ